MNQYRDQQRKLMAYKTPRDGQGRPLCHLCNKRVATQQHEIIARNMTIGNEKARQISYSETLCSYLCEHCHAKAPTREIEIKLWQRNFDVYTKEIVLLDIKRVALALGFMPTITLPEETNG